MERHTMRNPLKNFNPLPLVGEQMWRQRPDRAGEMYDNVVILDVRQTLRGQLSWEEYEEER